MELKWTGSGATNTGKAVSSTGLNLQPIFYGSPLRFCFPPTFPTLDEIKEKYELLAPNGLSSSVVTLIGLEKRSYDYFVLKKINDGLSTLEYAITNTIAQFGNTHEIPKNLSELYVFCLCYYSYEALKKEHYERSMSLLKKAEFVTTSSNLISQLGKHLVPITHAFNNGEISTKI